MKTYNSYLITLTSSKSKESMVILAALTEKEYNTLTTHHRKNYGVMYKPLGDTPVNGVSFKEALNFVTNTKLHEEVYEFLPEKTTTKSIVLPKGVTFSLDSFTPKLIVRTVGDFATHTHETVAREVELMKWIVDKFPTAKYGKYRCEFILPSSKEEFYNATKTSKYRMCITLANDNVIDITTHYYKKIRKEI